MKRAILIITLLLPLYSIAQDKNLQILQEAIDGRDPASITILDLSEKGLISLPPEIVQLQNLTVLDLSENDLTSLPSEIVQLKNLTELWLWNNDIPKAERQKIESWLPKCEIIWERLY